MIVGIVDSTIIIQLIRKNPDAEAWMNRTRRTFAITPVTWMELMVGAANKQVRDRQVLLLDDFQMIFMTADDQQWAMEQMHDKRLSDGVGIMDCFQAAVARRLALPVYTHNVKDFLRLLPASLVIKPY